MSVSTKRTRDGNGALASLDLEAADAEDRRFDVPSPNVGGTRLLGFNWVKSAGVATDVEIYRVDAADSSRL